jgi:hypothetical protein
MLGSFSLQEPLTHTDGCTQNGPVVALQLAPSAAGAWQVPIGDVPLNPLHDAVMLVPSLSQNVYVPERTPHVAPAAAKPTALHVCPSQNTPCRVSHVSGPLAVQLVPAGSGAAHAPFLQTIVGTHGFDVLQAPPLATYAVHDPPAHPSP